MKEIDIPYMKSSKLARVPLRNLKGVYEAKEPNQTSFSQEEIVRRALSEPIESPRLRELVKGKREMVIITSDHTRPVPSKLTMPILLEEIRRGNPTINITILIATGYHRGTTREELIDKFGEAIVDHEKIVIHDSMDDSNLSRLSDLPSGGECWVNKLALDAELLIAEGFIEPHFFAGFSGGRKSVLPGVAGAKTVLANHCAEFIGSPNARAGVLDGNPIHRDMVFAAEQAKLAFILNVTLDKDKRVVGAYAGHFEKAHLAGCEALAEKASITVPMSDIVITSNGGYPLDQNIYQAVKGMSGAESALKKDGFIIMVASCADGHGGESFHKNLAEMESPDSLLKGLASVPRNETEPDQWEFQIMARILSRGKVILVTNHCDSGMIREMGMEHADDIDEALAKAFEIKGKDASVAVIPDGVSVIVNRNGER